MIRGEALSVKAGGLPESADSHAFGLVGRLSAGLGSDSDDTNTCGDDREAVGSSDPPGTASFPTSGQDLPAGYPISDPLCDWPSPFGLYFHSARWCDPGLGRFAHADTIAPEPGEPPMRHR